MILIGYEKRLKETIYWDAKNDKLMGDTEFIKVPKELRELEKEYREYLEKLEDENTDEIFF